MFNIFEKKKVEEKEIDKLEELMCHSYTNKKEIIEYFKNNNNIENLRKILYSDSITISELIDQKLISFEDYKKCNSVSLGQIIKFGTKTDIDEAMIFMLKCGLFIQNYCFINKEKNEFFSEDKNIYYYFSKDSYYLSKNCLVDYKIDYKINEKTELNFIFSRREQNDIFIEFKNDCYYKKIKIKDILDISLKNNILYINNEEISLIDFDYINKDLFFNFLSSLSFACSNNINQIKESLMNGNGEYLRKINKRIKKLNNDVENKNSSVAGAGILGLMVGAVFF